MTKNFWKKMNKSELDRHYNPTLWTPRLTPDTLLPKHEELTVKFSKDYQAALSDKGLYNRITVGNNDYKSEVDICKPSIEVDNKTALIYIHGGWWQWFSKDHFTFVAKPFNKEGITVYIPGYTMAQDWENSSNPIDDIFKQTKLAIAEIVKKSIKEGIEKIYVTGHSAGGHLAAMMAFVDWEKEFNLNQEQLQSLKGVIPLSGLYDLRPLVKTYVNDAIGINDEEAEKVSPYYLLSQQDSNAPKSLPTFLVLPEYDPQEFYRQAREFQSLMHHQKRHCDLIFVPKADHLDMIENFQTDQDYMLTKSMLDVILN